MLLLAAQAHTTYDRVGFNLGFRAPTPKPKHPGLFRLCSPEGSKALLQEVASCRPRCFLEDPSFGLSLGFRGQGFGLDCGFPILHCEALLDFRVAGALRCWRFWP